jgi:hypothetical protein
VCTEKGERDGEREKKTERNLFSVKNELPPKNKNIKMS